MGRSRRERLRQPLRRQSSYRRPETSDSPCWIRVAAPAPKAASASPPHLFCGQKSPSGCPAGIWGSQTRRPEPSIVILGSPKHRPEPSVVIPGSKKRRPEPSTVIPGSPKPRPEPSTVIPGTRKPRPEPSADIPGSKKRPPGIPTAVLGRPAERPGIGGKIQAQGRVTTTTGAGALSPPLPLRAETTIRTVCPGASPDRVISLSATSRSVTTEPLTEPSTTTR